MNASTRLYLFSAIAIGSMLAWSFDADAKGERAGGGGHGGGGARPSMGHVGGGGGRPAGGNAGYASIARTRRIRKLRDPQRQSPVAGKRRQATRPRRAAGGRQFQPVGW